MIQNLDTIGIEVREYPIPGKYCGFIEAAEHVSLYSPELNAFWRCFGRGNNEEELADSEITIKANIPKDWLMQYACPGSEILVRNLINGTCHTIANRIFLIATEDKDVKSSGGDMVSVVAFGKYGIGLQDLKNLLEDSFKNTGDIYKPEMLEQVLVKLDSIHFELNAWIEFIHSQIEQHHESLKQYDSFIENLKAIPKENYERYLKIYINKREEIYNRYNLQNNWNQSQTDEYRKELAIACKNSIIDAITLEMKVQEDENIRKILESIIEYALKNYLKI